MQDLWINLWRTSSHPVQYIKSYAQKNNQDGAFFLVENTWLGEPGFARESAGSSAARGHPRRRDRFLGLRSERASGSSNSAPRDVGPGSREIPSGIRGSARPAGSIAVDRGRSRGFALEAVSHRRFGRRRSSDHALGLPALPPLPPARERRSGWERGLFGGSEPLGASGAFGIPPGFSEPRRGPPGLTGTSGLPRRSFGTGLVL